jgi:polar amino acid transport system substrate-binding protein
LIIEEGKMKNYLLSLLMACTLCTTTHAEVEAKERKEGEFIRFGTSPDQPPFEFEKNGELLGFDIDLARLIAKELGREAEFHSMSFGNILGSLQMGHIDAGISGFGITEERKKQFDFSAPYYAAGIAAVFIKTNEIKSSCDLNSKRVGAQLGSIAESWTKEILKDFDLVSMDTNNQLVEAMKVGHADAVIMDSVVAEIFVKENPTLGFVNLTGEDSDGLGIAIKKDSPLTSKINLALKALEKKGEITKLKNKWLKDTSWKN